MGVRVALLVRYRTEGLPGGTGYPGSVPSQSQRPVLNIIELRSVLRYIINNKPMNSVSNNNVCCSIPIFYFRR